MTSVEATALNSNSGFFSNAVNASASSTVGTRHPSILRTACLAPAPGPMAKADTRSSTKSKAGLASRSMIAVTWAACSASAALSPTMVNTHAPAPELIAATHRCATLPTPHYRVSPAMFMRVRWRRNQGWPQYRPVGRRVKCKSHSPSWRFCLCSDKDF